MEIDLPILPTFVFALEADLPALAAAAVQEISPHPSFSIFRHAGRIPVIADQEVNGLRNEEESAAATAQAMRDADSWQAAEKIRIAAMKTEDARRRATKALERERRKGLRSRRDKVAPGTAVEVAEMPAMRGVTGVVMSDDGAAAWVRFGTLSWKIDTWRLSPLA